VEEKKRKKRAYKEELNSGKGMRGKEERRKGGKERRQEREREIHNSQFAIRKFAIRKFTIRKFTIRNSQFAILNSQFADAERARSDTSKNNFFKYFLNVQLANNKANELIPRRLIMYND
jgi:hypothetical protein